MRTRMLALVAFALMTFAVCLPAHAIIYGVEDVNGLYPNVASVRGIYHGDSWAAASCTGSLLHVDNDKFVILTASHCTDNWQAYIAYGLIDSVGVSFDHNNRVPGSPLGEYSDGTYYVRGGVPISFPGTRIPDEKLDFGLVVFPRDAVNGECEEVDGECTVTPRSFDDMWPGLVPVRLPSVDYVQELIDANKNTGEEWFFTAVGFGVGEKFPIPGVEQGPADPQGLNLDTFPIRHYADSVGYNAYNPQTGIIHLSQNIAKEHNGTCNGDSGGPIFYEDEVLGRVLVSVVSGGDRPCRATNVGPAISLPEAFEFIGCGFVGETAGDVEACIVAAFGL